jgi:hypothetical protein
MISFLLTGTKKPSDPDGFFVLQLSVKKKAVEPDSLLK